MTLQISIYKSNVTPQVLSVIIYQFSLVALKLVRKKNQSSIPLTVILLHVLVKYLRFTNCVSIKQLLKQS